VLEVLLVHPGGPYWARRDAGAWSIPKGEVHAGEDERAGALRELAEETGAAFADVPADELLALGEVRLRSGKVVVAWALERELDTDAVASNSFELEWPPRSGRVQTFPEVDRAAWLALPAAREKLLPAQTPFLDRLAAVVGHV
jgi:predicted NUDIX family NTP pyrophosphohydrolase